MAFSFVHSLVKHTLKLGGDALAGGIIPIGSIASAVFVEWCATGEKAAKDQAPPIAEQARVRAELELIVQDARAYRAQVDQLLEELGASRPDAVRQAARTYLNQLPGRVQRSLRRPDDPGGRTVPASFILRQADDLKKLLPECMPRFQPGAKPVPGTDLVIEELLGVGGFGEVWKASHQSRPHLPPVALKFCIDETAARTLRKEVELLDRVSLQGRHRGIVELRYAHLEGPTPCLEYEYVDGGDLACLVTDLHRAGKAPPLAMTRLFYSLVQAVGFAHRIQPPIVHRDLKPTNVLTTRIQQYVVLKVLDFGIGGIATEQDKREAAETVGPGPFTQSAGTCTPLYASPQQRRGDGPDPRDDVYALGVIWYQMLVGDVTREPPRGGSWKKRLLDQGTTPSMLALLERCLEDDPPDRPADAQVLTEELQAVITEAAPAPPRVPGAPGPAPVPAGPESAAKGLAEARRLVKKPAIALLSAGILGLPISLVVIINSAGDFLGGHTSYPSLKDADSKAWDFMEKGGKSDSKAPVWDSKGPVSLEKGGKDDWPQQQGGAEDILLQLQRQQEQRYREENYYRALARSDRATLQFVLSHFFAAAAGVAIWAGLSMRKLRRYWLCLVGSIAMIPALGGSITVLSPMVGIYLLLLVGTPLAIWALRTLRNAEVRSAFS